MRYLDIRFGVTPSPRPTPGSEPQPQTPRLVGPGLRALRPSCPEPWRLPLHELADQIAFSFLDYAKVAVAEACGLERTGLTDLLYGDDRIRPSIDALTYARHRLQLRREEHHLAGRWGDDQYEHWRWQCDAVTRRLKEANTELQRQRDRDLRLQGLTIDHVATDDPREQAHRWLAQYLRAEFSELFVRIAAEGGAPPRVLTPARSPEETITRAYDRGLLVAPVTPEVERLRSCDDAEFRRRVLNDAGRQNDRDDILAHPLLLHRWHRQLRVLQDQVAPSARASSPRGLDPLPWRKVGLETAEELSRLMARRTLFAVLLQRSDENRHLRNQVADAIVIAEACSPDTPVLREATTSARAELVRRHPALYRLIRDVLEPHLTRYGRLKDCSPERRRVLRSQVMKTLDQRQASSVGE
ncbi:hypothetical protein ACF09Z_10410 [Streptomyces erythrochromogenes]|uniref:hypothetical protein n=1 Tax=Streptomyces erythrochromogenes TaxID=285574 RepID=UPI0036FE4D1E